MSKYLLKFGITVRCGGLMGDRVRGVIEEIFGKNKLLLHVQDQNPHNKIIYRERESIEVTQIFGPDIENTVPSVSMEKLLCSLQGMCVECDLKLQDIKGNFIATVQII